MLRVNLYILMLVQYNKMIMYLVADRSFPKKTANKVHVLANIPQDPLLMIPIEMGPYCFTFLKGVEFQGNPCLTRDQSSKA